MGLVKTLNASKLWYKQSASICRRLTGEGCVYIPLFLLLWAGAARGQAPGAPPPPPANAPQPPPPAKTIPPFRFARHDQSLLGNADLPKGKVVLFVFFDPDCDHCQRTVQHMNRDYAVFRSAAVYFVSMASQDKIDVFAASYAPKFVGQRNVWFLRDAGGGYMLGFHPIRYPSIFVYSPEYKLLDYEDNEETLFRIERSVGVGH